MKGKAWLGLQVSGRMLGTLGRGNRKYLLYLYANIHTFQFVNMYAVFFFQKVQLEFRTHHSDSHAQKTKFK